MLASTKDHAHRIYLGDGIYAEVTLAYRQRQWQPLEWTYPDYRRDDYQEFFTRLPRSNCSTVRDQRLGRTPNCGEYSLRPG